MFLWLWVGMCLEPLSRRNDWKQACVHACLLATAAHFCENLKLVHLIISYAILYQAGCLTHRKREIPDTCPIRFQVKLLQHKLKTIWPVVLSILSVKEEGFHLVFREEVVSVPKHGRSRWVLQYLGCHRR